MIYICFKIVIFQFFQKSEKKNFHTMSKSDQNFSKIEPAHLEFLMDSNENGGIKT